MLPIECFLTLEHKMPQRIDLFSTELITIYAPEKPLNCQLDGGHLVVEPHRKIADRIHCTAAEASELMAASMLTAKAMLEILDIEKLIIRKWGTGA
jgi:hypothetical protein